MGHHDIIQGVRALRDTNAQIGKEIECHADKLKEISTKLIAKMPNTVKEDQFPTDLWISALDASPIIIVETLSSVDDPIIIWAGRILEDLLGYFQGELQQKNISILIPEDGKEQHRSFMKEFQANPKNMIMGEGLDLHWIRKDGEKVLVRVHLTNFGYQGRLFTVRTVMFLGSEEKLHLKA